MTLVAVPAGGCAASRCCCRSISIGGLFKERASFDQSYDEGRFGRFGRHILGFELALDLPFGIGPLQFGKIFPETPTTRS